jgi:hypothetical protein
VSRDKQFRLVMTDEEKAILMRLAERQERSAAAQIRHLVKREAARLGIVPSAEPAQAQALGGAA